MQRNAFQGLKGIMQNDIHTQIKMHQIALQGWVDFRAQEGDREEKSSQYRHPQNILQDPVNFRAQGGDQRGSERMNLCRISL